MNDDIKISIIIPVYNAQKYIERCLESVFNQTYQNIEVIAVDDASTDASLSILKKMQNEHSNLIVLNNATNSSVMQARKRGVNFATGDYIMSVDPDDTLELNACEIIAEAIEKNHPDVIGFNSNVISTNGDAELANKIRETRDVNSIDEGLYSSLEAYRLVFQKDIISFSLINKAYKNEVLKKGFEGINDDYINIGEDFYINALALYFAKNFLFIKKRIYNYSVGSGISTKSYTNDELIDVIVSGLSVDKRAIETIKKHNPDLDYISCLESNRFNAVPLLWHLLLSLDKNIALTKIDKVLDCLDDELIIKCINGFYPLKQAESAELLVNSDYFKANKKDIKNIAIYCFHFHESPYKSSIISFIKKLSKKGYKLYVSTEKVDQEVKEDVIVHYLEPFSFIEGRFVFNEYHNSLRKLLASDNIDLYVYLSPSNAMFYDWIIIKNNGLHFIASNEALKNGFSILNNEIINDNSLVVKESKKLLINPTAYKPQSFLSRLFKK